MEEDSKLLKDLCDANNITVEEKIHQAILISNSTGELMLTATSMSTQTCEIMSKLLLQSRVITKLDVSDCLLPAQGLTCLLNSLPSTKINSLILKGNNINASLTFVLARVLQRCSVLKMLVLEWNNIGRCCEAMEQFCKALSKNSCLEILDLRNNHIDQNSCLYLSHALSENCTLRVVDLRWNCIGREGAESLLSSLQVNKTLTALKLSGNSVPNDLASAIGMATKHNISLYKVRSEYDARTDILAKHVRLISEQRAQELKLWSDKNQQNLRETEQRLLQLENMLSCKQNRIEELEIEKLAYKQTEEELKKTQGQWHEAKLEINDLKETLDKMISKLHVNYYMKNYNELTKPTKQG